MRAVFIAPGSRGDVLPALRVARRLLEEHGACAAVLAAHAEHRAAAEAAGLQFVCVPGDPAANRGGAPLPLPAAEALWSAQLDAYELACRGADVMVFNFFGTAAWHLAQSLGTPAIALFPVPFTRTRAEGPFLLEDPRMAHAAARIRDRARSPAEAHLAGWALAEAALCFGAQMRRYRQRLGLAPLPDLPTGGHFAAFTQEPLTPLLYTFSAVVCPRPADYHRGAVIVGYCAGRPEDGEAELSMNFDHIDRHSSSGSHTPHGHVQEERLELEAFLAAAGPADPDAESDADPCIWPHDLDTDRDPCAAAPARSAAIYVGFGSSRGPDPVAVATALVHGALAAGRRVILSRGLGLESYDVAAALPELLGAPGSIAARQSVLLLSQPVPHAWLLPRVALAVHHGGAGTTGAALAAGCAQLVCPVEFDQAFWGRRCSELGVMPTLPRPLTPERIADRAFAAAVIREALRPQYAQKAARIAAAMRGEDGAGTAAAFISTYLTERGRAAEPADSEGA